MFPLKTETKYRLNVFILVGSQKIQQSPRALPWIPHTNNVDK